MIVPREHYILAAVMAWLRIFRQYIIVGLVSVAIGFFTAALIKWLS